MMKQLHLPGVSLWIEKYTQCGACSGLSETLGESYGHKTDSDLIQLWVISVSVSVPAFPCFLVALSNQQMILLQDEKHIARLYSIASHMC